MYDSVTAEKPCIHGYGQKLALSLHIYRKIVMSAKKYSV